MKRVRQDERAIQIDNDGSYIQCVTCLLKIEVTR